MFDFIVSTRVLRLADILAEDNAIPTSNQKALGKKSPQTSKI